MGCSGTLCIRVPGKSVRWYNHFDSHPANWAPYIIAELRMLLLLHSIPDIVTLVHNLQPIDPSLPPTPQQMAAFGAFGPIEPDPRFGHPAWVTLLRTVRMSLLSILTLGWYEMAHDNEEHNYVIDFTSDDGRGRISMSSWSVAEQCVGWVGLAELPAYVVRQLIRADERWLLERNREGQDEESKERQRKELVEKEAKQDRGEDAEAALAHKERGNRLYKDKQSHTLHHGPHSIAAPHSSRALHGTHFPSILCCCWLADTMLLVPPTWLASQCVLPLPVRLPCCPRCGPTVPRPSCYWTSQPHRVRLTQTRPGDIVGRPLLCSRQSRRCIAWLAREKCWV